MNDNLPHRQPDLTPVVPGTPPLDEVAGYRPGQFDRPPVPRVRRAKKPSLWGRITRTPRRIMRSIISRFAGAVVAGLVTWLVGTFGIEVTAEDAATLTEAVTIVGMIVFGVVYGIVHKLIDRRVNPLDAARVPPPA